MKSKEKTESGTNLKDDSSSIQKDDSINICSVSMLSMFMDMSHSNVQETKASDESYQSYSSTMLSMFMNEASNEKPTKHKKSNSFAGMLLIITLILCMSMGIGIGIFASQTTFNIYKGNISMGLLSQSFAMWKEFPLNITHRMISTDATASSKSNKVPLFLFDPDFSDAIVPEILSKCFKLNSVSLQSFLKDEKVLSIKSDFYVFAKSLCDFTKSASNDKRSARAFQVFTSLPNPSKSFILFKDGLSNYKPEEYHSDNLLTRSILCKYNTKLDDNDLSVAKKFMEFVIVLEGTSTIDANLRKSIEMLAKMYKWDYGEKENKCIGSYMSRKAQKNNNPRLSIQNLQDLIESNQYDLSLYAKNVQE